MKNIVKLELEFLECVELIKVVKEHFYDRTGVPQWIMWRVLDKLKDATGKTLREDFKTDDSE